MGIKVEKRLPFGFKGEWGKVYKLYTYEVVASNIIEWQKSSYVDIGDDVQFKYIEDGIDKTIDITQPIMNLPTKSEFRLVKTTDAYFNVETSNYECVVGVNDIVKVFGCWWVVEKIEERSIFTPSKQTFYYCGLKKIFEKIVIK